MLSDVGTPGDEVGQLFRSSVTGATYYVDIPV